jgi:hypothetical protein
MTSHLSTAFLLVTERTSDVTEERCAFIPVTNYQLHGRVRVTLKRNTSVSARKQTPLIQPVVLLLIWRCSPYRALTSSL